MLAAGTPPTRNPDRSLGSGPVAAGGLDQGLDVRTASLEVVVHDAVHAEASAPRSASASASARRCCDPLGASPRCSEPPALLVPGRGVDEQQERRPGGASRTWRAPCDVDLEERRPGRSAASSVGRALEVVEERRPLEEAVGVDPGLELLAARRTRRRRRRSPGRRARVVHDRLSQNRGFRSRKPGDERALADPARAGDDDDQRRG